MQPSACIASHERLGRAITMPESAASLRSPQPASLALPHREWSGLPIALERLPAAAEMANLVIPQAALAVARSGSGKRWLKSGRDVKEVDSAPGTIDLLEAGFRVDWARWDGTAGEVIAVQFPHAMVDRLLHDDVRPLNLHTAHSRSDPELFRLVEALWSEAVNGSPLGTLYDQGLTLALIGLLQTRYCASDTDATRRVGVFGYRDARRLRTLIAERLAEDLRIERLAECVSMSPHHFARTFKATFGQSPHAYVLEQRIRTAAQLLRSQPHRHIADVAIECGFSSNAHFTEAFRRMMGTTPGQWRRN